jgi:modification target Cys-rich repeat protein
VGGCEGGCVGGCEGVAVRVGVWGCGGVWVWMWG